MVVSPLGGRVEWVGCRIWNIVPDGPCPIEWRAGWESQKRRLRAAVIARNGLWPGGRGATAPLPAGESGRV
jgi:hypothetical protein